MTMKVKDVMHSPVTSAPVGTSVQDAFEIMREGGFRHLPVVDEQDRVMGILSDRDLRNVGAIFKDPGTGAEEFLVTEDTSVDKIMVPEPFCVSPEDSVVKAVQIICDKHIGCLIVAESGRPVGILSYLDLLAVLVDVLDAPAETDAA